MRNLERDQAAVGVVPSARLEVSVLSAPTQHRQVVLGWPESLRLRHDAEARLDDNLEANVAALLACGLETLGGVALAARLRYEPGEAGEAGKAGEVDEADILTVGWPGQLAAELLQAETLASCGPARECERSGAPVDSGDLTTDPRWPAFARVALAAGVCSVISLPLDEQAGCSGSLSFYATTPHELSSAVATARLEALAAHVSVLVANAAAMAQTRRTIEQLREAMTSRSVIEQAKGVLMAREQIDAETAWEYLVKISQRTHRKLRDICVDIVSRASAGSLS